MKTKKAIILLSGGLDSTVLLALAKQENFDCLCLSFDYGQRHRIELEAAKAISSYYQAEHRIICLDQSLFTSSALVGGSAIPKDRSAQEMQKGGIPPTYVPARNTLFLAYAASQAEAWGASRIYIGPNAADLNCYPDCSPAFIEAFQGVLNNATKQAIQGNAPQLIAPLLRLNKTEIVALAIQLKVPIQMTHSCYDPDSSGKPCQRCDACMLRREALQKNHLITHLTQD